jgi:flagellar M-ring protein FliF
MGTLAADGAATATTAIGTLPGAAVAGGTGGGVPLPTLPGSPAVAGLLADESMVNIAMIEGQMRASSLRKLSELVDKHPDETLTIMRNWMTQDNG